MEILLVIGLIWFVVWLLWAATSTKVVVSAPEGQRSFKENQYKEMTGLEMKIESDTVSEKNLPVWLVKIRGLFPISSATTLSVITSVLDVTEEGKPKSILSGLEDFQEPDTRAFQCNRELDICEPGQGYVRWANVGVVPKDILMYPHSGQRKILFIVRIVDQDNMPTIEMGFTSKHVGIIQQFESTELVSVDRGFLEKSTEDLGVAAASVRLGIAVAFADGRFDPLEGKIIKEWSAKFIGDIPQGFGRDKARAFVNDAIRYGMEDAKNKKLAISSQVDVLNKLADKPMKYATIELCLDVMAADGRADTEEISTLNRLCDSLGLDSNRFNELRDHRLINVESSDVAGGNIWEALSIDSSLPVEEKKKELLILYGKWNARSEALANKQERDKAHKMVALIAEARKLLNA